VDPRRQTTLAGLQAISQDNGVEVPIPLIDDAPSSSLDNHEKPLPSEPETPRARRHAQGKASVSMHRPVPQPIVLPTVSDIAIDVANNLDDENMPPGRDDDIERGRRMPSNLAHLGVDGGAGGQLTAMSDRSTFSPPGDEDSRLLKSITIEPPTPVTTDSAGELITLPHKRRSPSPAEDLLNDDAPLPITAPAEGTPKKGNEALPSPPESEPNATPSKDLTGNEVAS
jgi:hypothetical protein